MTCKEKLMQEHPEKIDAFGGSCIGCPSTYGYLPYPEEYCRNVSDYDPASEMSCVDCWNREIPGTENISIKNKEEKTVAVVASNIKRTKAELQEEINSLKKEIANLERYKAYEDLANEMVAMKQAFVNAGFTDAEAFTMIMEILKSQINIAFKR